MKKEIENKSKDSQSLDNRVNVNAGYGNNDLNSWIFSLFQNEAKNVLDLCCGRGNQTFKFAEFAEKVYAVDASAESLAAIDEKGMNNIKTLLLSIDELSQNDELNSQQFDIIHCAYGLYYAKDAAKVIETAHKLLTPGGILVVVGPTDENNQQLFDLIEAVYKIDSYILFTSRDFMNDVVEVKAKELFNSYNKDYFYNQVTYPNAEELYKYIKSSTMYDESYDKELQNKIKESCNQEGFTITKKAMGLVAKK